MSLAAYGSGHCKGELVNDDIWIGKEADVLNKTVNKHIHITNFTMGVMTDQTNILDNFRIDAIIGLTYSKLIKPDEKKKEAPKPAKMNKNTNQPIVYSQMNLIDSITD